MVDLLLDKLHQLFPDEGSAMTALSLLSEYGIEAHELEQERVQLAILKLSEGDLSQLHQAVTAAKVDYRDVLAWAEYPEQTRAGASGADSSPESLCAMRKRDRQQYEQWLGKLRS
jgi:hypothetical protein